MLQTAKIKIRNIKELQADNVDLAESVVTAKTPLRKRKKPRAATTAKKLTLPDKEDDNTAINNEVVTTVKKRVSKSALKEPPPWQKPIDAYFKSCQKTYKVEGLREKPQPTPIAKNKATTAKSKNKRAKTATTTAKKPTTTRSKPKRLGRKRLFDEPETETTCSYNSGNSKEPAGNKMIECILIDSDSEDEKPDDKSKINKLQENDDNSELDLRPSTSNHLRKSIPMLDIISSQKNQSDSLKTPCHTEEAKTRSKRSSNKSKTTENSEQIGFTGTSPKLIKISPSIKISTLTENSKTVASPSTPLPNPDQSLATPIQTITRSQTKTSANKETSQQASSASPSFGQQLSNTSKDQSKTPSPTSLPIVPPPPSSTSRRKPKPCPPYKIIEGTTFAVDAFQFGYIPNVSHYFLTHFHADHYIGLTRKFAMPLYMSPITARFVREFIPIDEQYINILELNEPQIIDNIEITALDANHCPGAVIIVFKFLATGKCILHTGDFRAWHGMESEPIFWNNDIHTIYLDTTYISDKYAFCTQYESIDKAKLLIKQFQEKHEGKRILYICGSYVIGKEKFWCALAEEYEFKVWAEGNRFKALKAMEDERLNKLLVQDVKDANMHVIPMGKLGYLHLVEYFSEYESQYDTVLAIRPSGWEKDSKPQYRGKINIIGVEYSEHSSYREMQRFVKFLKPQHVLSTVPTCKSLMITANIPQAWYKYDTLKSSSNYQPTLDAFCKQTPLRKKIRPPNMNVGGLENFVSPLSLHKKTKREINNNSEQIKDQEKVISIHSSENEFETGLTTIKRETEKENEILEEQEEPPTNPEPIKETQIINNAKTPKETKSKRVKKKTTPDKNNIKNFPLLKNDKFSVFITESISVANSSEDFEMPEILCTQNKNPPIKQTQHGNFQPNKNGKIKKKLVYDETSSTQKSSAVKDSKRKFQRQISRTTTSEDEFEITQSQKTVITRNSHQNGNSQNKANQKQKSVTTTSEEETDIRISKTSQRKKSNRIFNSQERLKPVIAFSETDREIPVSQKTRRKTATSTNSTTSGQKLEQKRNKTAEEKVTKRSDRDKQPDFELPLSQTRHNKSRKNPLNKSATTSNTSINSNDEIARSSIQIEEYSPKPLRVNGKETTPITPHNSKASLIPPSISRLSSNPLLKSTTTSNYSSSLEEIPPSQTTLQHASTPRPLRNKRNASTPSMANTATPIKKSKDFPSANNSYNNNVQITSTPISPLTVKEILQTHSDLDFYNHSQMSVIVEETLSKQCLDTSTDHIPSELLSDPDADDDWM